MKLPRYVVLKSMYNNKYLSYRDEAGEDHDGFIHFSEEDNPKSPYSKLEVKTSNTIKGSVHLNCSFNNKYVARQSSTSWWITASRDKIEEDRMAVVYSVQADDDKAGAVANRYAKFEVQKAKSKNGLVHLKCCYNNKNLVRSSPTKWWICAAADPVQEDLFEWSCTLFKAEFVDDSTTMVRFLHVQLGHYTCLFNIDNSPFAECLYAGWKDLIPISSMYVKSLIGRRYIKKKKMMMKMLTQTGKE
ncbi:hypothetical protein LINGRAHAP2_LOCUS34832 [Linum grandiflorum]